MSLTEVRRHPRQGTDDPPSPRAPRSWPATASTLAAAAALGIAVGFDPSRAGLAVAATVVGLVLLLRFELAAGVLTAATVIAAPLSHQVLAALPLLVAITAGAWAIRLASSRDLHPPATRLATAVGASLGVLVASGALQLTRTDADATLGLWVLGPVVALLAGAALRGHLRVELLARILVAASAPVAVYALVREVQGEQTRLVGQWGGVGQLAAVFVIAIALAISVRRLGRRAWPWDVAALLSGAAAFGLGSGAVDVALVAMLVIAVASHQLSASMGVGIVGLVMAAAASLIGLLAQPLRWSTEQHLLDTWVHAPPGPSSWSRLLRQAADHPLLGAGPGSYPESGTWAQVAAGAGVLGVVALLAVTALAVSGAWRSWHRDRTRVAGGVLTALGGVAMLSLTLGVAASWPCWLLVALAGRLGNRADARLRA